MAGAPLPAGCLLNLSYARYDGGCNHLTEYRTVPVVRCPARSSSGCPALAYITCKVGSSANSELGRKPLHVLEKKKKVLTAKEIRLSRPKHQQ